jgi:hypothetical protein
MFRFVSTGSVARVASTHYINSCRVSTDFAGRIVTNWQQYLRPFPPLKAAQVVLGPAVENVFGSYSSNIGTCR